MERKDKAEFKKDAAAGSNNNARIVLPKIEGIQRGSLTGSETFSLITSASSVSPYLDSDIEDMALQEDDEDGENEEEGGEAKQDENDQQLSMTSEKEIRQRAKVALKKELKRIRLEATAKKNDTRKKFKTVIDDARSQLIATRIEAEKVSIEKLEEKAEMKQAIIFQERAQRMKKEKANDMEYEKSKTHSEELAMLRKIQSDLDRARARRKHSLAAALTTVNGKARVSNLLQHEVKRLERAEEVQQIIVELHSLGLTESANDLTHALRGKEESENKFRKQLNEDQLRAKKRAASLVESEIKKVRKECLAEMERNQREREEKERLEKERKEREQREREMAKIKKMARDMAMKKMFKQSMLNTRVSRPFSFSYFPSLKK
ncbi:calponin homology domain-containing protein DDB_G0272472-like [Orbicella faveolata]|uniref:calponin homology domain-containing protein DDB_G0272472-like n=1 Tax=Orbicella faveolata TaxID=48498 RepID=UPI0009E3330D|nr:calponin homology domain-containing protein DDB_G0272472-like [Orbicella faveolata]